MNLSAQNSKVIPVVWPFTALVSWGIQEITALRIHSPTTGRPLFRGFQNWFWVLLRNLHPVAATALFC